MDAQGALQEQVYDVVRSSDRKPDAPGKLPSVGTTVDIENEEAMAGLAAAASRPVAPAGWKLPCAWPILWPIISARRCSPSMLVRSPAPITPRHDERTPHAKL